MYISIETFIKQISGDVMRSRQYSQAEILRILIQHSERSTVIEDLNS